MEVKAREFEAKILLSCFAAEQGYGALLVHKFPEELLKYLPIGIYIEKDIAAHRLKILQNIYKYKMKIVCLDEEALLQERNIPSRAKRFATFRYSNETLELTDQVLAWGGNHKGILSDFYPNSDHKINITGNPRMDLLRPEFIKLNKAKSTFLKKKWGPYIFMPSAFSGAININGLDFLLNQFIAFNSTIGKDTTDSELNFFKKGIEHSKRNLEKFSKAIIKIAESFKKYNIIIRPHPQDDPNYWNNLTKELNNVHVIYSHTVKDWIMGCEVMIHNNCTSGLEGYILQKSVIQYSPYEDEKMDRNIENAESFKVKTEDDLLLTLSKILNNKIQVNNDISFLSEYISSLKGKMASEKIIDSLNMLDVKEVNLNLNKLTWYYFKIKLKNFIKSKLKVLFKLEDNSGLAISKQAQKNKFSGISLEEVNYFIKSYSDQLDRFHNIEIIEVTKNSFYIGKKEN